MAGRPSKYDPSYNQKAFKLCLLGAKDKEIASFLEISEATLNNWKIEYPEFLESLRAGKEEADQKVSKSLYKRAVGFKFDEVTKERIEVGEFNPVTKKQDKKEATLTKIVTKYIVPDTTAQIFWLKNRRSDLWRDKQELAHTLPEGQTFKIGNTEITF